MTAYRLNGRLLKLEHALQPTKPERMPAAQRHARLVELILRMGVEPGKVEATLAQLRAMTPAERQAWIRAQREK